MNIEIGKFAGFCDGVKHAVEQSFYHAAKTSDTIYVDGNLIHNPQTLDLLKKSGVETLTDSEDMSILSGKTVIVRAHGVSPERREQLKSHASNIINLTCKYVSRAQGIVKKYSNNGYRIIIIGNSKHPEIIGVVGFASKDNTFVISKEEDINLLPEHSQKTLVIAQTTLEKSTFDRLVSLLQEKYNTKDILVKNTICNATEIRQKEVVDIANRNDVVLIIGGFESSNTKNLYKIASSIKPSFYIEFKEDLEKIDLSIYNNIGIMAGASTPDWVIKEIANEIESKYSI